MFISIVLFGLYLGRWTERGTNRWIFCKDELPKPKNHIENYPVAFFDSEFGIVIDQAEFHPEKLGKWRMVLTGEPCQPFAWYNLPAAPRPRGTQDIRIKTGINDYI